MISRLTRSAKADVADALRWYRQRDPGLDARFLDSLHAALASIERYPSGHPRVHKDVGWALLSPFPYAVFYTVRGQAVIVLAVMHTSRDPQTVRRRIR